MPRRKGSLNTKTLVNKQPKADRYIGKLKFLTEHSLSDLEEFIKMAKANGDLDHWLKALRVVFQYGNSLFVDEEAKRLQELTDKVNELLKAQQKAENKVNKTFSRVASDRKAAQE